MSPRLFPRSPKKAQDVTTEFELGTIPPFFSNDLQAEHASAGTTAADQPIVSPIPAVAAEDQGESGWYPDTTDPGLMRYWDGFQFHGPSQASVFSHARHLTSAPDGRSTSQNDAT